MGWLPSSPTGSCATWRAFSRSASTSGVRAQPPLPRWPGLTFVNWQEPIGCGGVAVYPDDVVVVDDDGAVLIPAALVEEVVRLAPEQERMETWIMEGVTKGAKLPGLYPPNEDNLKRYKDWASRR